MCSPGVTLQPIYLRDLSGDDECWVDAGQIQACRFGFTWFSPELWEPPPRETLAGRRRIPFCLCLPGSVTGICPCRMKERRARLVTAPRGQAAHPRALSPSNQTRPSSDATGDSSKSSGSVINCACFQRWQAAAETTKALDGSCWIIPPSRFQL